MSIHSTYSLFTDCELLAACDQHLGNPLIAELQTRLAGCVDRLHEIRIESSNRDEQVQRLIGLSEQLGDRIEALENKLLLNETA